MELEELLLDEELLDEDELLEEEELELLLEAPDDDEFELELEEELLEAEVEELLELEELELDELLEPVPPLPTQLGAVKLPSWLPCTPNTFAAVAPGAGNCQLQQFVNWKLVPGLVPVRVAFH